MESVNFLVQGSAEEPYRVTFSKHGSNLSAFCSCPAGVKGQYCKHRISILMGDDCNIVSGNNSLVSMVKEWLIDSDVEVAINELRMSEEALEQAKAVVSHAKKKLAKALYS